MKTLGTLALLAVACTAQPASAQDVYKWTDANGKLHYGDHPPDDRPSSKVGANPGGAQPGVAHDVEVKPVIMQYYEIKGDNTDDLQKAINVQGPSTQDDPVHRTARTNWNIAWNMTTKLEQGQCRVDAVKISVSTTIIFPKWSNPWAGLAETRAEWERMTKAQLAHENGHRDNAIKHANELARELHSLSPQANCDTLLQNGKSEYERIRDNAIIDDETYDRNTKYGETQGAKLRSA